MSNRLLAIALTLLVVNTPLAFAAELRLTYDANGNLVTGDGKYRVYNSLNQLTNIYNGSDASGTLLEEYEYHPTEERILIKDIFYSNGTLKETTYYLDDDYVRVVNNSGTFDFVYVHHNGVLVAQTLNGTKLFIHGNHEGSSSVVTNASGTVVENTTFSPFGEVLTGGSKTRFNYEGKEQDSLVGDTDLNFRKYLSPYGIFTQPDNTLNNVYNPQNLNRYSFELNNPIKNTDPNGHCPICFMTAGAFILGSLSYMAIHDGSGWSHVVDTYEAGAISAAAVAGSYAFATSAGAAVGASGAAGALTVAGKFIIGAGAETVSEAHDGNGLDPESIAFAGLLSIPDYGLRMKPGTFMGSDLGSVNNLKFAGQQFVSAGLGFLTNLIGIGAPSAGTKTLKNAVQNSNSVRSSSMPTVGSSYTTSRGVQTTITRSGVTSSGVSYSISAPHVSSYGW